MTSMESREKQALLAMINARIERLAELKEAKEQALQHAPNGSLRISTSPKGYVSYYWAQGKEHNGKYLAAMDPLITTLAQKSYDREMLQKVKEELRVLDFFSKQMSPTDLSSCYTNLRTIRKKLVVPDFIPDDAYIKTWEEMEYARKPIGNPTGLFTQKGEEVRSKTELVIADILFREKIPYRYEARLFLDRFGTVYPDFTILRITDRKLWYMEHNGLMGDEEYRHRFFQKHEAYQRNGIFLGQGLLYTFEDDKHPLNTRLVENMIKQYFS